MVEGANFCGSCGTLDDCNSAVVYAAQVQSSSNPSDIIYTKRHVRGPM